MAVINAAEQQKGRSTAPDVFDLGQSVALANTAMFAPYKVAAFAKEVLHGSPQVASLLLAVFSIGIGIGVGTMGVGIGFGTATGGIIGFGTGESKSTSSPSTGS